MSTRLDLPPARDLPDERRREIRTALVRASQRRRRPRRWLVTVPVAVLVVLLGLVLARPWDLGPPSVGVPAATPSRPADPTPEPDRVTPSPDPAPVFPPARPTDEGPLSAAARARVVKSCSADLRRSTTAATVHFARRTSTSGDVVLFTGEDGLSYSCSDDGSGLFAGPGSKTRALPTPDAAHPAVRVDGDGLSSSSGQGRVTSTTSAAYRVGDEVASLQSRLVVDGHAGAWFEASRAGGWAWTSATLEYASPRRLELHPDYRIDVRAFDADGRRLAVDRTPR